jgi:hypothetical protein
VRRQRGARTRDAQATGPNGATTSVHDERSWNRAEGEATHDRTRTFANGDTRSVSSDVERTAPGEYAATRTVTGRDGETRTQTGAFTVPPTETGRAVTGDIQTEHLGQVDYARSVSRDNGVRKVNAAATFEDGSTIARTGAAGCDGAGTCTASGEIVNRAGETTAWTQSRTRNGADAAYDRATTFSDGSTRTVAVARDGNGDGTGAVTRTVTGRDGETRTQTGVYDVNRTED